MFAIFQKKIKSPVINQMDYITVKLKETNANFLVHVSSTNVKWHNVEEWEVTFEHEESNWSGTINSLHANAFICASSLSGWFRIKIRVKDFNGKWIDIHPKKGYKNRAKSFPNSVSLLIIEANENLNRANFYVIGNNIYSNIIEKSVLS